MTNVYPASPATLASQGAATLCGVGRNPLRSFDAVMRAAHGLWSDKTPREIAARTGIPPRTFEYWQNPKARGVRVIVERFLVLIRCDVELAYTALGDDTCARIAREVRRRQELAELRAQQARQAARIEKLERKQQEQTRSVAG